MYFRNQAEEGGQVVTKGDGNVLTRFGKPCIIGLGQGSIWGIFKAETINLG